MLSVGIPAPSFSLPDQNGQMHALEDYRGKKVILYFYPKDNTAGCTKQACAFGELYPQFMEKGAGSAGREQGQRGLAQKIRGKVRSAFYAAFRP